MLVRLVSLVLAATLIGDEAAPLAGDHPASLRGDVLTPA
jgi:hypothetical protein